jgi:ABC-2 type transport system permease protein
MARKQQISNGVNRTIRAIIGATLILVIAFSAISICQNIGKTLKLDVTDQKLYTLSDGTKAILDKLRQPIKARLYYAKTAALKGPDQIRYFNNYYEFVKALLEEYVAASKGMVELEVIDPRPFSDDEVQAMQYGLRRFPITQEEKFFFGLVVLTQFGVEKAIPFFSPDRQNFVEYDISYMIDTAINRQKRKIGVISSLPVMGEDVSNYMAQMMRMQGKQPKPAWTFVEQLRKQYEVKQVATDVNDINDVDMLLVIHPKDLPEKTLFAIDQFVLKGGRTIVCVDPHCFADRPDQMTMQMRMQHSQSSDLNALLRTWGLEVPENTFAGDRDLAITPRGRREKVISFLTLTPEWKCFNTDNVITAELNQVTVLFSGVLREVADSNEIESGAKIERTPLLMTSNTGNSWKVSSPYELVMLNPQRLMEKFAPGTEPVPMGYLITGRFKSSFPDGIDIEVKSSEDESSDKPEDPNEEKKITKHITGLKVAQADCAVVVFADVDFISDGIAYQDSFFGPIIVGDNSALMLNTIDDLGGSSDLVSIRSRGNFRRPFVVVDAIERQAEAETAEEVAKLNAEIAGFTNELQSILASAKEEKADIVGRSILQKQRDIELKKRQAERQLKEVQLKRRERIEHLGNMLQNINMLTAPAVILVIAIALGVRRSVRKRHYISHASDA